ncbi:MAG: hypothetical protein QM765_09435 [Myxococcales bacterium]
MRYLPSTPVRPVKDVPATKIWMPLPSVRPSSASVPKSEPRESARVSEESVTTSPALTETCTVFES